MNTSKPLFDIVEIQKRIPHRFPFLLIDRVESIIEGPKHPSRVGRKIIARKNVTMNEPYFTGHFPHKPLMPGVLQIEAMAQAGALACVEGDEPLDVLFAKIDNARFRKQVVPGDVLEIHAEVTREKSGILGLAAKIFCDGELVSEVSLVAKVFPKVES